MSAKSSYCCVFYVPIIVFYLITLNHTQKLDYNTNEIGKTMKSLTLFYFTGWNFGLQIYFLILAVLDETLKILFSESKLQKRIQKGRHFIFSTLVFPSSCLVMTIFWSLWHIDRELIFPKAIDSFYPNWLNHTLHTFISVPLILEIFLKESHYHTTRKSPIILIAYATVYEILFLSVYFCFGVWIYPIYEILNWTQRIGFIGLQLAMLLIYQKIGILLLRRDNSKVQKVL